MKIIDRNGQVSECAPEEELHVLRHSAAHIMAQAIKRIYPEADFAFGPATQNGFYYDVDLGDKKLTPEDLEEIEKDIIDRDYRDMHRETSPLKQAEDAVLLDSSELDINGVVAAMKKIIEEA